jgi:hypothetical protein
LSLISFLQCAQCDFDLGGQREQARPSPKRTKVKPGLISCPDSQITPLLEESAPASEQAGNQYRQGDYSE